MKLESLAEELAKTTYNTLASGSQTTRNMRGKLPTKHQNIHNPLKINIL